MSHSGLAPGQFYGNRWIIYSALSEPIIRAEEWHLKTSGLVERPLDLSFEEVQKLPQSSLTGSFQCVTKWTIKDVAWEGVAISEIAKMTGVKAEAKWVLFCCADGYTAPVPLEDALENDSLLAFKMNGHPIPQQQGYPCRPFISHLYGWKSAKWLIELQFLPAYADGYWENFGYNERGDIWEEERFKGHEGKHSRRRSLGTAPI